MINSPDCDPYYRTITSINVIETIIFIAITLILAVIVNKFIVEKKVQTAREKRFSLNKIICVILFSYILIATNCIWGITAISVYYYGFFQWFIILLILYSFNLMLQFVFYRKESIKDKLISIIPTSVIENIIYILGITIVTATSITGIAIPIILIIYKIIYIFSKRNKGTSVILKITNVTIYLILVLVSNRAISDNTQITNEELDNKSGIFLEQYAVETEDKVTSDVDIINRDGITKIHY